MRGCRIRQRAVGELGKKQPTDRSASLSRYFLGKVQGGIVFAQGFWPSRTPAMMSPSAAAAAKKKKKVSAPSGGASAAGGGGTGGARPIADQMAATPV